MYGTPIWGQGPICLEERSWALSIGLEDRVRLAHVSRAVADASLGQVENSGEGVFFLMWAKNY